MLRLKISHFTKYEYEKEVSLSPHNLFLIPQIQSHQRLIESDLSIIPVPDGQTIRTDLFGNKYSQIWFSEFLDSLSIQNEITIESEEFNPFNFLIDPEFESKTEGVGIPAFTYSEEEDTFLRPFIRKEDSPLYINEVLDIYANTQNLLDFLVKLTSRIYQGWTHVIREEENIWTPEFTFSKREGSCRDLANLQMHTLGMLGLATRFVSGYAFNPKIEAGHELHAWLEVYVPGASWIGLDPSLGLLVGNNYVPLAFHADPIKTLPVQGSFFGEAKSKLTTEVRIEEIS